jgi:decaprenylphospho-beta-D-ribofuranose 2-oxidase
VIARGCGRSYGDLAQNAGGLVLDLRQLDAIEALDAGSGLITVQAGCSLEQLLRAALPEGWFLPVTPGTRFVTVGGAIACDVHGKNHHQAGSFARQLRSLSLLTPGGEIRRLTPEQTPDEFWATAGGLGLTGIILEATLQLLSIETAFVTVDVERATDFDRALERLTETDRRYRYSVAWLDCASRGRRFGRAVLLQGDHARLEELPAGAARTPPRLKRGRTAAVPPWLSAAPLLRSPAVAAFNELYFRSHRPGRRLERLEPFFYPLDSAAEWNRLYGRAGFLQYQVVVPFGAEDVLGRLLAALRKQLARSTLAVLKRFGAAGGPLSFAGPGWTLALDLPLPQDGLARLLDEADAQVAGAGGRVYLAKDARLRPELLGQMYPRLEEWRAVQARLDPEGLMQCDLDRRLGVTGR